MKYSWRQRIAISLARRAVAIAGTPISNPERWAIALFNGTALDGGIYVDEASAMRLTAVYRCINFLSSVMGSMPFEVFTENINDEAAKRAPGNYLYPLLEEQPNDFMTSTVWRQCMQSHISGWGNGYSEIQYNGAGRVAGIWPILPANVKPQVYAPGKLRYEIRTSAGINYLDPEQVLHIPGLSYDGITGYSPVAVMRRTLGLAIGAEEYGAKFYENDARPGIVLKHPKQLGDKAYERLKNTWVSEHGGVKNAWRPRILEESMDVSTVSIPQVDQQFIETRKFEVIEICRMFGVPPHFVFELDKVNYNSIEQLSLEFVKFTLLPIIIAWEQETKRKLFGVGSNFAAKFDIDAILRGDFKTRMDGYGVAVQWGLKTRDEVRRREGDPPLPADQRGSEIMVPVNMRFVTDPVTASAGPPPPANPANPAGN